MVIVDDSGSPVSFAIGPDTVFFAPKGLPHAFWPTGDEPLRFLLGFDHQQPATSDFSQMMSPLPDAVIDQAAGVALDAVPSFPTTPKQFAAPDRAALLPFSPSKMTRLPRVSPFASPIWPRKRIPAAPATMSLPRTSWP